MRTLALRTHLSIWAYSTFNGSNLHADLIGWSHQADVLRQPSSPARRESEAAGNMEKVRKRGIRRTIRTSRRPSLDRRNGLARRREEAEKPSMLIALSIDGTMLFCLQPKAPRGLLPGMPPERAADPALEIATAELPGITC
jgi:hypothetical protein